MMALRRHNPLNHHFSDQGRDSTAHQRSLIITMFAYLFLCASWHSNTQPVIAMGIVYGINRVICLLLMFTDE